MTVIDSHHHVWDLTVRDQPWIAGDAMAPINRTFTLDDLRPSAEAAGVTATVLVQTVAVAAETPDMLALAAADPLVAGVVGWTDLTSPAIADELARLGSAPGGDHLVAIRHLVQAEPDPDWLRRPDVTRALRAVEAAGLGYDLVIYPHQLPAATAAADAVPALTFVLDHAAKPPLANGGADLGPWTAAITAFAARPNTVCKLSGLVTVAAPGVPDAAFRPAADVLLSAFGPDRLLFGSDWPVCLLGRDYAGVMSLARALVEDLSAAEQTAVFSANAARVYRLDPTAGPPPGRG
jgi:L-fuconolactonase